MVKKTLLLVEDNPKVEAALREMLGRGYRLEIVKEQKEAEKYLKENIPDLILIDFDLEAGDGLQVFKEIQHLRPDVGVIMLASSGSVPLAVSAAKSGVSEVLRKPLNAEQLREAVSGNLSKGGEKRVLLRNIGWLRGESLALKNMLADIRQILQSNTDLFLIGEQGIDKKAVVEIIHRSGPRSDRKLVTLDLAGFRKQSLETSFWTVLREILAFPDLSSVREKEDFYGTAYIDNFENMDKHFQDSLLDFLKARRGKIDKSIRVIIGFTTSPKDEIREFGKLVVPSLRQRKEDLPYILSFYLAQHSRLYNKNVVNISAELLEFLMSYDYPGNYLELERLLEQAVLASTSEVLGFRNFPFNFMLFFQNVLKNGIGKKLTLEQAKREFEKKFYRVLLDKLDGDQPAAARFLDVPKTIFAQRIEELQKGL